MLLFPNQQKQRGFSDADEQWTSPGCNSLFAPQTKGGYYMANENTVTVNRTFKSTVFIMLFEDKNNLLELYNAMTEKHYTDPELLEINTLENAIYMTMKNDVSFLIDGRLSLYEHQSTYNPNLPLRFLLYISKLYAGITKDANLYGTKVVHLPSPEFVIFYNGEEEKPERMVLKLSDMYEIKSREAKLELQAVMLNISGDNNTGLKEACRTLKEYAIYTNKIRKYTKSMVLSDAVERAINECIAEGVLEEFLKKHKAEAKEMSIFEYDQEKHMKQEREAAWEDGHSAGIEEGRAAEAKATAKRLSAMGMTIENIAKAVEASIEEIQEWID